MRNKLLFCLLLSLFYPIFLCGQNVVLVGKTNKANALVRLLTYDEMLTCEQTKVAETQSDNDGKFRLETNINEIKPAQIAVNLERVNLILTPNGTYNLEIIIPKQEKDVSYFEKEQPVLKINSADDGGFYSQYVAVQSFVDGFFYDNFDKIYHGRRMYLLDTLDNQINKTFGKIKSSYIKDFVKYRKASVVMTINGKKAVTDYFDKQKVLYSQAAYMDVFSELFKTNVMSNDFLSRNPQLAELIKINNLRKAYFENPSGKDAVLKSLDKLKNTARYQKNKLVAQNVLKQVNDLSYDSEAPRFSLKDRDGKIVKLSDYQNDMVLLQFVGNVSPLLEHEFFVLNELHNQWNDTIRVVTIATEESFDDYVQLFDKQGFKWQILNLGDNILLLEDYHIVTYPAYVILKKKNRVGMAPAPSPERNLDIHVRRISKYL